MDDEANVGLIDSHAEGAGGNDDRRASSQKIILHLASFISGQAGMISARGDAFAAEVGSKRFCATACRGVENNTSIRADSKVVCSIACYAE